MAFHRFKGWAKTHADIFLDLTRVYLGIGLLVKGFFFLAHGDYLMKLVQDAGDLFIAPATIAHYVIPVHIVGGALLAAGLMTRIAALAQIPILIGAMFWLHLPKMLAVEPRQNLEFSALVLFLMVLILIFGAGRWSMDHFLSRRTPDELQPEPAV